MYQNLNVNKTHQIQESRSVEVGMAGIGECCTDGISCDLFPVFCCVLDEGSQNPVKRICTSDVI